MGNLKEELEYEKFMPTIFKKRCPICKQPWTESKFVLEYPQQGTSYGYRYSLKCNNNCFHFSNTMYSADYDSLYRKLWRNLILHKGIKKAIKLCGVTMKTFTVYNDPGHGWVKVPRKLLTSLEILDKISSCSYQRGNYVYLEEDRDAPLFVNTIGQANAKFVNKFSNKQSKIRSYDCFQATI